MEEINDCSGWTIDFRLKDEPRSDFLMRQQAFRLDSDRHKTALCVAIFALMISGLHLFADLVKLLIDTLSAGTIATP